MMLVKYHFTDTEFGPAYETFYFSLFENGKDEFCFRIKNDDTGCIESYYIRKIQDKPTDKYFIAYTLHSYLYEKASNGIQYPSEENNYNNVYDFINLLFDEDNEIVNVEVISKQKFLIDYMMCDAKMKMLIGDL